VLGREQPPDLRLRQYGRQEAAGHLARQQPVAVLGEGRGIPDRIVHAKADKPAEQQVEVDPSTSCRSERIE
jgi:hypothetical protein